MNHYLSKKYLNNARLHAYLEQYKYVNNNEKVLEIGNGAGVFGSIVSKITEYKVIDIDETTNPDYIADITKWESISEHENKFDVIFCCQVLEHIPYKLAIESLNNLVNLNPKRLVISVPDNRKSIRIKFKLPKIDLEHVFSIPFSGIDRNINNNKEHHWEIWHKNFDDVLSNFKNIDGYTLKSHYRLFERSYQHFFILEKQ